MENVDKRIARNTAIIIDCLEDLADLIEAQEYEYTKEEVEDQIRQIDTAIQYVKQSSILRCLEGMNLTQPVEKNIGGVPRPVVCVETGKVYDSIKEAGDDTGINTGNISSAVRGINRTAGGYHWMVFIEERPEPINRKFQQAVICVETGEIFGSIKEAEEKTGIRATGISAVVNGRMQRSGGYHWKRYEEPRKKDEERTERNKIGIMTMPKRKTNAKPVMCIDTGEIFESAAAAGLAMDVSRNLISQAANGKKSTAGGYKWRFVDKDGKPIKK